MRLPRMTTAMLLAAVAVIAILLVFERYAGNRLFFGVLPALAALMGIGFKKLQPPGHRTTVWEMIVVGLVCFAILALAIALKMVAVLGPAVDASERARAFLILLAAGVAPLLVFLVSTWLLRLAVRLARRNGRLLAMQAFATLGGSQSGRTRVRLIVRFSGFRAHSRPDQRRRPNDGAYSLDDASAWHSLRPAFRLPDTAGATVSLDDFKDAPALLVSFICNHCPYVKHVRHELSRLAKEYQSKGVAVVGISSNDVTTHPDDSPAMMAREKAEAGYSFPYLYDETQQVALAYKAACTPDFYVFDKDQKLVYRGQMDASRPGNAVAVTGKDLRSALDAALSSKPVSVEQRPSMGCNIKWKRGNEPEYS